MADEGPSHAFSSQILIGMGSIENQGMVSSISQVGDRLAQRIRSEVACISVLQGYGPLRTAWVRSCWPYAFPGQTSLLRRLFCISLPSKVVEAAWICNSYRASRSTSSRSNACARACVMRQRSYSAEIKAGRVQRSQQALKH